MITAPQVSAPRLASVTVGDGEVGGDDEPQAVANIKSAETTARRE
jgi:hypothetical protein